MAIISFPKHGRCLAIGDWGTKKVLVAEGGSFSFGDSDRKEGQRLSVSFGLCWLVTGASQPLSMLDTFKLTATDLAARSVRRASLPPPTHLAD